MIRKTDSPLAVIGFAYASNSFGNIGAEMVKYFLQLAYGLDGDYRWPAAYRTFTLTEAP